jgi:hypothetical protein
MMACISWPEMYLQYVAAADCLQAEVVSTVYTMSMWSLTSQACST